MSRPERVEETMPVFEALINYSVDTGTKPASYGGINTFEADKKRTGKYQEYKVPIYDGRVIEETLSLEREGFIFVRHETQVKDFYDEAQVRAIYYPEIEQLVKETSRAGRVLVFDHTLRALRCRRSGAQRAQRLYRMVGPAARARPPAERSRRAAQASVCRYPGLASHSSSGATGAACDCRCQDHWHKRTLRQLSRVPGSRRRSVPLRLQPGASLVLFSQNAAE